MNKSETIGALAEALSNFLGEVKDPSKNRMAHNNAYADLPQILSIVRPLLHKNGLSIIQFPAKGSEGKICIETVIMHKSGEWMSSEYEMDCISHAEIVKMKSLTPAQATGIIISYARRYALTAVLGICANDDTDGNIESNSNRKLTGSQINNLLKECNNNKEKIEGIMKWANINNIKELTVEQYEKAIEIIKKQNGKQ